MKTYVILISGRGSNMEALLDAGLPGRCAAVISNRPDAEGLALARARGAPTAVVDHRAFASREAFDAALAAEIDRLGGGAAAGAADEVTESVAESATGSAPAAASVHAAGPDLVLLAGFMRILSDGFVRRYEGRMLNIHPSLLPLFPGTRTHAQALAAGVRVHGCSVHFVTPALDGGPIVAQAAVAVAADDDAETLGARVLAEEHRLYPRAARWFLAGRLRLIDGRARLAGETPVAGALHAPHAG